jgi:hypothetical protein
MFIATTSVQWIGSRLVPDHFLFAIASTFTFVILSVAKNLTTLRVNSTR